MSHMTMNQFSYNATSGMFEARIDVQRGGVTFRYPCAVAGPVTMEPATARSRLMQQARRMSENGSSLLSIL